MAEPARTPLPPEGRVDRFPGWFADRLRHWRRLRGLSQEGLGWAAEISTRHLSFLESGRSRPSEEMLMRLLSVLDVPLSERNRILVAEGHQARYPAGDPVPTPAESALRLMMDHHDPFPLAVLSASSMVVRTNRGAKWLFRTFSLEPALLDEDFDMVALVLDPRLTRTFLVNFEELALRVLERLHLGSLERPQDPVRRQILARALAYPGITELWGQRTNTDPPDPATRLHLLRDGFEVCFETLLTSLSEPLQPAFRDLFIESYFPADEATRTACRRSTLERT